METSFFLLMGNVAFVMDEDFPWDVGLKMTVQAGEHLFRNDGAPASPLHFCHEVVMSLQLLGKQII